MGYSRKTISNAGDRVILEKAEAREIFRTWQSLRDNDFVRARLERCEKIYGTGARDRVRTYMGMMKNGTLE
jgi:predicted chitinase